jgi:hypothetical protein
VLKRDGEHETVLAVPPHVATDPLGKLVGDDLVGDDDLYARGVQHGDLAFADALVGDEQVNLVQIANDIS